MRLVCFSFRRRYRLCQGLSENKEDTEIHWDIIAALLATVADTCIIQAQDFLGLGSEARMNTPSTVGINWKWRAGRKAFNKELAQRIRKLLILYKRLN